jgi:hypothetical protein
MNERMKLNTYLSFGACSLNNINSSPVTVYHKLKNTLIKCVCRSNTIYNIVVYILLTIVYMFYVVYEYAPNEDVVRNMTFLVKNVITSCNAIVLQHRARRHMYLPGYISRQLLHFSTRNIN